MGSVSLKDLVHSQMKIKLLILCAAFIQSAVHGQQVKSREDVKPLIIGEIRQLQSKVLNEKRIVNVYLPEGYSANDSLKYPVIYLLDGSVDEDFIHISGLVQYNSFEWVHRLPKSIVVGIATVDRRRDFTFPTHVEPDKKLYPTSGHSDRFISFLETELQPFISRNYRTTPARTIIGQSLGGLLAAEILMKKSSLFSKYIIISPSLWWDNASLLENWQVQDANFKPLEIYIGVGKEGLTPTATPRVMEVDANLLAEKIKAVGSKSLKVIFDYLPQENHATIMHQAVSNAFAGFAGSMAGKY